MSVISKEDFNKLDHIDRRKIVHKQICPYCNGRIVCIPITEYNYKLECEDCEEIFEEE